MQPRMQRAIVDVLVDQIAICILRVYAKAF